MNAYRKTLITNIIVQRKRKERERAEQRGQRRREEKGT